VRRSGVGNGCIDILRRTRPNRRFHLHVIDWLYVLTSLAKTIGIVFLVVMPMVAYTVYAERKVCALIQDRVGPNRVGAPLTLLGMKKDLPLLGLGQPVADAVKLLLKEDFTPAHVNKFYYWLAPALAMIPSLLVLAVIPFGSTLFGVPMVIADVGNVGVLFVFAISSLGVYGIVARRLVVQLEIPLPRRHPLQLADDLLRARPRALGDPGLSRVRHVQPRRHRPIPGAQRLDARAVHRRGRRRSNLEKPCWRIPMWISFVVFTISMFAETNRVALRSARGRARNSSPATTPNTRR
jgi:NADH-quinone oxidoreductase subunit H